MSGAVSLCSDRIVILLLAGLFAAACHGLAAGAEPELLVLSGELRVHDPVMTKSGDAYYLFATSGRRDRGIIPIHIASDMRHWTRAGFVFDRLPAWAAKEVPRARGAWAPDISFFNGKFHLYYSLSSFGVNDSAIGLATNTTLNPSDPAYKWIDEGQVIRSRAGEDDFNAIDPNLVIEDTSNMWLAWGSFWGGIMMRRIDPRTGKLSADDVTLHKLAVRAGPDEQERTAANRAIEAPFIVRRGDHWYLFVSWDFCCRGARSNYKVVIGRSSNVIGPYVDKESKRLSDGGGSLILEAATGHWRGAGHPAVYHENGTDYVLFHAYSADNGRSRLHISTIVWDDGWPRVAALP
jgi:arabinan endo-1,5-alpha-L-arabinosidase